MAEPVAPEEPAAPPRPRGPEGPRRIYITKRLVEKFGATPGCEGCDLPWRAHNEECRARMLTLMENDAVEKARLDEHAKRVAEALEESPRKSARRLEPQSEKRPAEGAPAEGAPVGARANDRKTYRTIVRNECDKGQAH